MFKKLHAMYFFVSEAYFLLTQYLVYLYLPLRVVYIKLVYNKFFKMYVFVSQRGWQRKKQKE